jgi:SH3-like domain-containing protein
VIGRILNCAAGADWCRLEVKSYRGWLPRSDFWGTKPGEAVQQ